MIAEIVKSLTVNSYQIRDIKTLRITTATGADSWRPGDRVVVSGAIIIGKASDTFTAEVVRV